MVVIKSLIALSIALLCVNAPCASVHYELSRPTLTPIKHVVVVMLQNESFDRYFGRYPIAENKPGEAAFHALNNTPQVTGYSKAVLTQNPNLTNPYRLAPAEPTCDLGYGPLAQKASYNHGENNMFIWLDSSGPINSINDDGCFPQSVMGYYDGNTLHALWHYAQEYVMADHFFATDYSSTVSGLLNEIAGTTHGVLPRMSPGVNYHDYLLGNNEPLYDDASSDHYKVHLTGNNIGDLLNQKQVTWGAFIGGFMPSSRTKEGKAILVDRSLSLQGSIIKDYFSYNDPFQYFKTTANPHHLAPESEANIGYQDQANHQYDLSQMWLALKNNNLPAVSYVIPKASQNGHVGSSSPLDEQAFLTQLISRIKQSTVWPSTAVMLVWNNSDGWYDHVTPPKATKDMAGTGYGPRLPFLIVSKWAKHNVVDHQQLDQSSVLRFIENNWNLGFLGKQTPDRYANSLDNMFDFHRG
ncbi:alkaline phosphatase family protein [Marinomonas flavescens]|uniref:alkaline phosphatase family protein n=1 Tax=Marinomonas flavescens TaxID=2529379 RepID=UPI0014054429|nr:alkaline phosphatase family protein [Marinomonas flavescens]